MLLIGSDNNITFNLKLAGTSQVPTVRVLLQLDSTLLFPASRTEAGEWTVNMKIPDSATAGSYDFWVEVLVGGRIFTPLKDKLAIGSIDIEVSGFPIAPPIEIKPVPIMPAPLPGIPPRRSLMKSVDQMAPTITVGTTEITGL